MTLVIGLRRVMLFLSLLMSGGALIFPRVPLLIAVILLSLLIPKTRGLRTELVPYIFVIAFILMIEFFRPGGAELDQIGTRAANFAGGLLLADIYLSSGSKTFEEDVYYVTKIFPIQAIVTTIVGSFVPAVFINVGDTSTFLFLLYHHTFDTSLSFGLVRPDGFFWEPGVLQIYLNICLYLSLFRKNNRFMAVVTGISVVCTQSTTGIVITSILSVVYVYQITRRGAVVAAVLFASILLPLAMYTVVNYENKTSGVAKGSFSTRKFDTLTGLEIAFKHPFVGIGFNNIKYINEARESQFYSPEVDSEIFNNQRGNTNGFVQPLYTVGVFIGIILLIGLVRQKLMPDRRVVAPMLLLSISSEPLVFTPFFLMLIATGLSLRREEKS